MTDKLLTPKAGPMKLEDTLADLRGEAAVLRSHGSKGQADTLERACEAVATTMRDYLDWLTEDEARLASGWSAVRLRRAFPGWQEVGMAEFQGEGRRARRRYRRCIVPRRANALLAYQQGRRSA